MVLHLSMVNLQYFNSQPHEEADSAIQKFTDKWNISTHSLTKRLTAWAHGRGDYPEHFNSQPHEEADKNITIVKESQYNFNSQPHEEADGSGINDYVSIEGFQLTASRRG